MFIQNLLEVEASNNNKILAQRFSNGHVIG